VTLDVLSAPTLLSFGDQATFKDRVEKESMEREKEGRERYMKLQGTEFPGLK